MEKDTRSRVGIRRCTRGGERGHSATPSPHSREHMEGGAESSLSPRKLGTAEAAFQSVDDADLTFWADVKAQDAQGRERTPPHILVAYGKQLCCFSEAKFRALVAKDQPASYMLAFDWLDGLWNGQLNKQPMHVAVCVALLEHAFVKGLHAQLDGMLTGDEAVAADGLQNAKRAMQSKFGEDKRFATPADVEQECESSWSQAYESFTSIVPSNAASVKKAKLAVLASLELRKPDALPPLEPILDAELPKYSSRKFKTAKDRDARADQLGTHTEQLAQLIARHRLELGRARAGGTDALEGERRMALHEGDDESLTGSRRVAASPDSVPGGAHDGAYEFHSDGAQPIGSKRKQSLPPASLPLASPHAKAARVGASLGAGSSSVAPATDDEVMDDKGDARDGAHEAGVSAAAVAEEEVADEDGAEMSAELGGAAADGAEFDDDDEGAVAEEEEELLEKEDDEETNDQEAMEVVDPEPTVASAAAPLAAAADAAPSAFAAPTPTAAGLPPATPLSSSIDAPSPPLLPSMASAIPPFAASAAAPATAPAAPAPALAPAALASSTGSRASTAASLGSSVVAEVAGSTWPKPDPLAGPSAAASGAAVSVPLAIVPKAPAAFEPLPPVAHLLRTKDHDQGLAGRAVENLLAFAQMKKMGQGMPRTPMETVVAVHASGLMFGFTRNKQTTLPQSGLQPPNPTDQSPPVLLDPTPQLKPLCVYGNQPHCLMPALASHGSGEAVFHSSLLKLHNTDKIIVCVQGNVKLYETAHEKIQQREGLNAAQQSTIERQFDLRMPDVMKNFAFMPAIHPRDNNLYATACTDGTIVIKNFHIETQHQVIGEPENEGLQAYTGEELPAPDNATPPPPTHVFFSPHGNLLVVVKTAAPMFPVVRGTTPSTSPTAAAAAAAGPSATCSGVGLPGTPAPAPPPTLMLSYEVPPYAIAPGAREPEQFTTSRDNFPETEDGQKDYEAKLKAEKKEKKEAHHQELAFWVDEVNKNNRGSRLLPQDPRNVQALHLGQPLKVVPRPSTLKRLPVHGFPRCTNVREDREYALLLWEEQAQLWLVAGGSMTAARPPSSAPAAPVLGCPPTGEDPERLAAISVASWRTRVRRSATVAVTGTRMHVTSAMWAAVNIFTSPTPARCSNVSVVCARRSRTRAARWRSRCTSTPSKRASSAARLSRPAAMVEVASCSERASGGPSVGWMGGSLPCGDDDDESVVLEPSESFGKVSSMPCILPRNCSMVSAFCSISLLRFRRMAIGKGSHSVS